MEVHLRDYLVEKISAPTQDGYESRPDFPIRILDAAAFWQRYESNYDMVLVCNFRLLDADPRIQPSAHLLAVGCAYDFFDSEDGVLTSFAENKVVKASSVLVAEDENSLWPRIADNMWLNFFDMLIAGVRGDHGRVPNETWSSVPGASARLFDGVRTIEATGQICIAAECQTSNRMVYRGPGKWLAYSSILLRGLARPSGLPGRSRVDISIGFPSQPIAGRRLLYEVYDYRDIQLGDPRRQITLFTVAEIFASGFGDGEMLISSPYGFIVASEEQEYGRQLNAAYEHVLAEIIQRLRLAK